MAHGSETEKAAARPSTHVTDAPPGATGRLRRLPRRRLLLVVGVTVLAVVVAAVVHLVRDDGSAVLLDRPPGPAADWLSGASGDGVTDDEFAEWRGSPVEIAGTWADNNDGQIKLWSLHDDFSSWSGDLDIAIGAIDDEEGESWAEAAQGKYDRRWRQSLRNMERLWRDRPGTLYIRFAHEMNGNWYPWSVTADDRDDFISAWRRFRAAQQEIFPESQLVFGLTRESVESGIDWRETFPGAEYVDVLGVDYYNQYPYVDTVAEFDAAADDTDKWGGPKGIAGYQAFAREQGLPLAVPEWGGHAGEGDSPAFIYGMYAFFARNGGTGPGQVLYEIIFNVSGYDDNFQMYPDTAMPDSAEQYRRLW